MEIGWIGVLIAFEQKPLKLTTINTGYQLALFLAITLVLGLF
ncbi:hypothetical protein [Mycobacterium sp.]